METFQLSLCWHTTLYKMIKIHFKFNKSSRLATIDIANQTKSFRYKKTNQYTIRTISNHLQMNVCNVSAATPC
jgi:hypothetical protein